jgi:transposase-like protein
MPNPSGEDGLFKGRHFDREIILVCVRWYLTYKLSPRDLVELKAAKELPGRLKVGSSHYLNNLIGHDHRRVKQRPRLMPGLKKFGSAVVTISGIELAQKIKKGQFQTRRLGGRPTSPNYWDAGLVA